MRAYDGSVHQGSADQHDTLILPRPDPLGTSQAIPSASAPPAPPPTSWGPTAPPPTSWGPTGAPVVIIRQNTPAIVGATLGTLALGMSVLPLLGILAWVIAPVGLLCSVVGISLGAVRRVGRLGAWWGLLSSGLALAICVAWVGLLLAL